jgi:glucose/arabinose dehydrogenase
MKGNRLGYAAFVMTFHSCFFRRSSEKAFAALFFLSFVGRAAEPINDPIPARIAPSDVRIELQPVAEGLGSPLLLLPAPDKSNRLFIVDQQGHVRAVQDNKLLPEPFLDVTGRLVKLIKEFDERGLLGVAFDPGYTDAQSAGKGRIFTYTSEPASRGADFPIVHGKIPPDHQSVIASWRVSPSDPNRIDVASRKELLRIDEPQFNHNAGMIAFGPDGFLYIATGDGGAGNDLGPGHNPDIGNGQDKNVLLGKMLRIDVNGHDAANGAYGIPKDNPFANGGGAREIFAIGLRNPYRFSFDGPTLLAGDVGQNKIEMLYRVERGGNYGWRYKEGTFKFNKNGTIEAPVGLPAGLTDPVLQYDHDEGISIVGGYVYHGNAIPPLKGKYVFGDYRSGTKTNTGRIFQGDLQTGEIRELRVGKDARDPGFLVKGFGQDTSGELYVTGSAEPGPTGVGGVVYKIVFGLAVP